MQITFKAKSGRAARERHPVNIDGSVYNRIVVIKAETGLPIEAIVAKLLNEALNCVVIERMN